MATPDLTAWRALVDKELAGAPFEKLIQRTAEGVAIEPLYTERTVDPGLPGAAPFVRGAITAPFKLCMRVVPGADLAAVAAHIDGGAEALWCSDHAAAGLAEARGLAVVIEPSPRIEHHIEDAPSTYVPSTYFRNDIGHSEFDDDEEETALLEDRGDVWSGIDWVADVVAGRHPPRVLDMRWPIAIVVEHELAVDHRSRCIRVSTLPFHDAGADAADELALGLSSLVATLRQLDGRRIDLSRAAKLAWAQVAIGRDTFGELCKLRALRLLWHKVFAAAGVPDVGLDAIHAVCSARTLSQRDPWVNMLRVTTQVFAAALGGAQLITPLPFDAAFATPSALGQRVARNTALVLREESQLGRVVDPGGGSYYLEARTDALAREAWSRFTAIERDGGIVELLRTGRLQARLDAAWAQRAAAIARRKEPVLGVSEFANLREQLPGTPIALPGVHRDAEGFEALRARVEAAPRDVSLIQLGPPAEHRARSGFAEGFFAVAGLRTAPREIGSVRDDAGSRDAVARIGTDARELGQVRDAAASGSPAANPGVAARDSRALDIACLCGSDERYAAEAVAAARALRAAGARRVVLAGRPGALEADLRGAGVDAFIYVGCDLLATLEEILA